MIDKSFILHKIRGEHNYNISSGICGVCGKKREDTIQYRVGDHCLLVPDNKASIKEITSYCEALYKVYATSPNKIEVSPNGANLLYKEINQSTMHTHTPVSHTHTGSGGGFGGTFLNTSYGQMTVEIKNDR